MPNLYTVVARREVQDSNLSPEEISSIVYHDIFDYPLNLSDLVKWQSGKGALVSKNITSKNGYLFVEGREGLMYKKLLRKRVSEKKLEIARKAARIISFVPWVKMLAVTGSLAMENASEESDIDLMVITKRNSLWITRVLVYLTIGLFGLKTRRPGNRDEQDKLCLNMWLDESDLEWTKKDRNVYTAHEIAQIIPLVNKDRTYEKFLTKNKWILGFWPNSVKIANSKSKVERSATSLLERICYWIQYQYMKKKISREVVTPTRALFHPQDWGKIVLSRLST